LQDRLFASLWRGCAALLVLFLSVGVLITPAAAQNGAGITSPSDGSSVQGAVAIFGTAVIDPFQKYELHYKQEPSGDDAFIYFDGGTVQITNGQLGVWQAGGLPPGTYSLRLRVVKIDGNYAEYYVRNLSLNQGAVAPGPASEEGEEGAEGSEPTPTPSEPTPTPIPTATFTPAPQPSPVVGAVTQPEFNIAPTPTPESVAAVTNPGASDQGGTGGTLGGSSDGLSIVNPQNTINTEASGSVTRQLGEALSVNRLRTSFFNGVRFSAALFFGAVAIYAGKRLFDWAWTQFS
jgi:hypothetical protein